MKLKQTLATASLLSVSLAVGLLLCEAGARLVLNPGDYLAPTMVTDDILGHAIKPNSSGYGEWGFRNKRVPAKADVVTVGDSHTYGNTATMDDAWPSVLARATGLNVYNLGLGGYGPNQYYHLLMTKGLKLHPKLIICGLYMGDDFENAFSITHGLEYWSYLRKEKWAAVSADNWDPGPPVLGAGMRNWLSKHSMLYRVIIHGPFLSFIKEYIRFKEVSARNDPYTTALIINEKNIREAFRPLGFVETLNEHSGPIREGRRITFHLLNEMDKACRQAGCRLLVVIIPTKESVFAEYIENAPQLHLHAALSTVISGDGVAKRDLVQFLDAAGIPHVDTLPALKQAAEHGLYAQTTRDMHPSKNGYRVIGEVVAEYLKQTDTETVLQQPTLATEQPVR
jgi:hypothetical protein